MDELKRTYLTPFGLKKLQEEYREIKEKRIPVIAQKIDEARQQGDLSENAEYHSAREEMAWVQTRLAELDAILQNVEVIKKDGNEKKVGLGSRIKTVTDKFEREYTIVGAQEADPAKGMISNESPIGRAFIGKKVGDKVEVTVPSGKKIYTILSIE